MARSYWRWLGKDLRLTRGGRFAFTAVLIVGIAGTVADAVSNDPHGDQAGGALFVFVGLILGAVVGIDATIRGVLDAVRRIAGRNGNLF